MSVHLAKDLRDKHHVRSLPVHKDDEVRIKRGRAFLTPPGNFKNKVGKVLTVYRKKWCIHVEKIAKEKPNGQTVQIPINTSNCELTNIKMTEFRKKLIQRKVEGQKKGKGLAPDID